MSDQRRNPLPPFSQPVDSFATESDNPFIREIAKVQQDQLEEHQKELKAYQEDMLESVRVAAKEREEWFSKALQMEAQAQRAIDEYQEYFQSLTYSCLGWGAAGSVLSCFVGK